MVHRQVHPDWPILRDHDPIVHESLALSSQASSVANSELVSRIIWPHTGTGTTLRPYIAADLVCGILILLAPLRNADATADRRMNAGGLSVRALNGSNAFEPKRTRAYAGRYCRLSGNRGVSFFDEGVPTQFPSRRLTGLIFIADPESDELQKPQLGPLNARMDERCGEREFALQSDTAVVPCNPRDTRRRRTGLLGPVRSGSAYRITSRLTRQLVAPELASALETVFRQFAQKQNFTSRNPLEVRFSRGFWPCSEGHNDGRAADIVAVGGKSIAQWRREWRRSMTAQPPRSEHGGWTMAVKSSRNLGFWLYKALQEYGGWRVDPRAWRPYRGVPQLFGPWTATEGPWKSLQMRGAPVERERLADQQWVFRAHRDHIHVAR
jgi:hypothetical protein